MEIFEIHAGGFNASGLAVVAAKSIWRAEILMRGLIILFFVLLFISSDIMACEGEPLYPDSAEIKIDIIP